MKTDLREYGSNVYSQYGEDGILDEILSRLEIGPGYCVEFGAADGVACSNTAKLWRHEAWEALLIEANLGLIPHLNSSTEGYPVQIMHQTVTPSNVDQLIGRKEVDLISIDVDGDDYFIFCSMWTRAKVLVIEYNRTIPPHVDLVPVLGSKLGIGSFTLKQAAEERGYTFLGLTEGSCIFVDTSYAREFSDFETRLDILQPPESFMYLATDFDGKVLPIGDNPPWGLAWPPSSTEFRPNQDHLLSISPIDPVQRLIESVERLSYQPQQIEEIRSAAMQIALDMRGGYNEELRARIEQELGITPGTLDAGT